MNIILASNSPRRRQLLSLTGLDFKICPADVDEAPLDAEPADAYVQRLAASKARVIGAQTPGSLVIAADTTVVDGNQILGKPVDSQDAARILRQLRGRSHQVYTAIAVYWRDELQLTCCATDVPMRHYSDAEMLAYIESGDPLDKAGAYAIQHLGFRPVEHLQGCYANVVGLPLCHLLLVLRNYDIELPANLPLACQSTLRYECPIYEALLTAQENG
jgi:MAF protein